MKLLKRSDLTAGLMALNHPTTKMDLVPFWFMYLIWKTKHVLFQKVESWFPALIKMYFFPYLEKWSMKTPVEISNSAAWKDRMQRTTTIGKEEVVERQSVLLCGNSVICRVSGKAWKQHENSCVVWLRLDSLKGKNKGSKKILKEYKHYRTRLTKIVIFTY